MSEILKIEGVNLDNGWIDVKDKTPDHGRDVFVTDGTYMGYGYNVFSSSHQNKFYVYWNSKFMENHVTHWKEIPEDE